MAGSGSTPNRGYPFYIGTDPADIADASQSLADAIDLDLATLFATRSRVRVVERTTSLTVPDSTSTPIGSYNTGSVYAPAGCDIAYGSGLFTAPVAGLYEWKATVSWPSLGASTSYRTSVYALVNGTEPVAQSGRTGDRTSTAWADVMSTVGEFVLNAGDTVQLALYQTSGSTLSPSPQRFSLRQIG